jgi:hypothetical protein
MPSRRRFLPTGQVEASRPLMAGVALEAIAAVETRSGPWWAIAVNTVEDDRLQIVDNRILAANISERGAVALTCH